MFNSPYLIPVCILPACLLLIITLSPWADTKAAEAKAAEAKAAEAKAAEAKAVYINDVIYVPMRSGPSLQHKILHKGLKSGTSLALLEVNTEDNYSLVRTANGLEGWILSRYLSEEPIAINKLKVARDQLDKEKISHKQTKSKLEELKQLHTSLEAENVELERIKSLSVDVIAVDEKNTHLSEENTQLLGQIARLQISNQALNNQSTQRWFLAGGGTVLLGMLFGFWFSRRIFGKQQSTGWT